MLHKKGQAIEKMGLLVIGLITIGIILVVGLLIMAQMKSNVIDRGGSSLSETNVTRTITINQFTTIKGICVPERGVSVIELWNDTTPTKTIPITSANYTISGNAINITDHNRLIVGSEVNISYSCTYKDLAYNGTVETVNATSSISGWLSIIVITIIGGAIVMLVMFLFGKIKERG